MQLAKTIEVGIWTKGLQKCHTAVIVTKHPLTSFCKSISFPALCYFKLNFPALILFVEIHFVEFPYSLSRHCISLDLLVSDELYTHIRRYLLYKLWKYSQLKCASDAWKFGPLMDSLKICLRISPKQSFGVSALFAVFELRSTYDLGLYLSTQNKHSVRNESFNHSFPSRPGKG